MRGGRERRAMRVACVGSEIHEGYNRPCLWVERVRVEQNERRRDGGDDGDGIVRCGPCRFPPRRHRRQVKIVVPPHPPPPPQGAPAWGACNCRRWLGSHPSQNGCDEGPAILARPFGLHAPPKTAVRAPQ